MSRLSVLEFALKQSSVYFCRSDVIQLSWGTCKLETSSSKLDTVRESA